MYSDTTDAGGALCVITARGGSKRIPRKNVREFCGRPIIAYSIEAALSSGIFDEVMVSTDDEEIADVARHYGASVPFMRSAKNSDDYSNTNDVLREVLDSYASLGTEFSVVCCLYPTAPFVTPESLREAMETLASSTANSLIPVVSYGFPPQRGMLIRAGELRYSNPELADMRSQDLEPVYHDCGQFYLCRVASFYESGRLAAPPTAPYVIPESAVQDIDTEEDWRIAELKFRIVHGEGRA